MAGAVGTARSPSPAPPSTASAVAAVLAGSTVNGPPPRPPGRGGGGDGGGGEDPVHPPPRGPRPPRRYRDRQQEPTGRPATGGAVARPEPAEQAELHAGRGERRRHRLVGLGRMDAL